MSDDIPAAVAAYLEAKDGGDAGTVLDSFAHDAVVHDEGHDHIGTDAIRTWTAEISAAYELTRTVLETRRSGAATLVRIRVAGNFPGSPVELHQHFTVSEGRITALTICP